MSPPARHELKKYREINALRIDRSGIEMSPCTRCENARVTRRCVAVKDGAKCSECTRQGKTCDVIEKNRMPSFSDWESLDRQRQRLDEEEEEAISKSQEAMAKILRLRKQKRFLAEREQEMLRRGLSTLNELDEAEEKEKEEEEKRKAEEARKSAELAGTERPSSDGPADPLYDPMDVLSLDPADPLWEDLGFVDGNWQVASGSEDLT